MSYFAIRTRIRYLLVAATLVCSLASRADTLTTPDPTQQLQADLENVLQRLQNIGSRVQTKDGSHFLCHSKPGNATFEPEVHAVTPTKVDAKTLERAILFIKLADRQNLAGKKIPIKSINGPGCPGPTCNC